MFSLIGRSSPDKDHNFFLLVWRNLHIGEEYLNQVSIPCGSTENSGGLFYCNTMHMLQLVILLFVIGTANNF